MLQVQKKRRNHHPRTNVAVIDDVHLTWINGTGQFLNIQGSATAKGRYISKNIYNVEWEGEYWIAK